MKTKFLSFTLAVASLLATTFTLRADPALMGNKGLAGQSLDADAIKAVLLGKKAMLGSDRVVIVIIKTSDTQEAFLKEHLGMTTSQFQNYWRRLFMTGGGSAPKFVETEADACKLIAETSGAVAVADSASPGGLVILAK